jgi:ATP-binding cassette subfamily C (CFTR/MRP) protein 1
MTFCRLWAENLTISGFFAAFSRQSWFSVSYAEFTSTSDHTLIFTANNSFQITTLFTYVTFVGIALSRGINFDFQVLFGSLASLKLVTAPLGTSLQLIAVFTNSMASLERVQTYLRSQVIDITTRYDDEDLNYDDEQNGVRMESLNPTNTPDIHLVGASFGVRAGQPILKDLNLHIRPGTFSIVLGKVAAGKSLLLRSLIGEMWHDQGVADLPSAGVAFCAQSPWLRNVSIRENILSETSFEEEWYATVVWSCALDMDFDELKNGDLTLIGSKGISLSGGQKNRIALARALYARNSTLILDDILSGLDKTTEMLVFKRVFSRNGLLRKSRSTVVLATHSSHWASEADEVITMSTGTILEQAPCSKLVHARELGLLSTDDQDSHIIPETDALQREAARTVAPIKTPNVDVPGNSTLTEEERRSGDKHSFMFYLSSVGVFHSTLYMVLLLIANGATTAQCE